MPVLTLTCLRPTDATAIPNTLALLATEVSKALSRPPEHIWTTYVEAQAMAVGPQLRTAERQIPTLVLRARGGIAPEQQQAALQAAGEALATGLGLSTDDVWVVWEELPPGHVYMLGQIY